MKSFRRHVPAGKVHSDLKCMDTLSGQATLFIFIFASYLTNSKDQLIKKRICSLWSKFFSLNVDIILKRLHCPEKQTGRHENCFPLKMIENRGSMLIHHTMNGYAVFLYSPSLKKTNFYYLLFVYLDDKARTTWVCKDL